VQAETRDALSAMEGGLREVRSGRELAARARSVLHEIPAVLTASSATASEIAEASSSQLRGTQAVAQAISSIGSVTSDVAASAQQTAATVEAMKQIAEHLRQAVSRFTLRDAIRLVERAPAPSRQVLAGPGRRAR
jgi:methyl-accepting chemotaxis protein